jgi:hypothetical protein
MRLNRFFESSQFGQLNGLQRARQNARKQV